ncbi:unnamed protein product [[Actinomadura] parvosata subsp. kistnae]|uniref:Uncharacterized protein n=1 Tax=[Actinomadura] parvosata subsp. kistnae TaxID=1909395 RepID=A0A1U9ZXV1_9ACTN|nr:hypothetical protein [Nonomuraea sp. ATCC 55076]AQZ62739.1 hypothetical protein BKM31_15880 [Nonomuraea sp. ATCC 55076]SPL89481.1 unnamed protein product [Actinomadura parvosata subsp. kistnae]
MSDESPNLALALETLRRLVEVGFERTNGSTTLILQRLDQVDDRHAELVKRVEQDRAAAETRYAALEAPLDAVEREAVTRTQFSERTRQFIAVVTVLAAVAGAVIALIQLTRG